MKTQVTLLILGLCLSSGVHVHGGCKEGFVFRNGGCVDTGRDAQQYKTKQSAGGCNDGFSYTGTECEDEDECDSVIPICGLDANCTNTPGSYYCTCRTGYRSSKGEKFTAVDSRCKDINECVEKKPCDPRQTCENTLGSFKCSCRDGYRKGRGDLACEDINECDTDPSICGSESEGNCTNTQGSYTCACRPGHSNYGNGQGRCTTLTCDGYDDGGSDEQAEGGLERLWAMMRQNCENLISGDEDSSHTGHGLLEDVLTGTDELLSHSQSMDDNSQVTGLLTLMEKAMMLIGPQLKQNRTKMESQHTEAEFAVKRGKAPPTGSVLLTTESASFKTSWETAAGNGTYPGFTVVALVSYKSLNSTSASSFEALREEMQAEKRKEQQEQKVEVSLQIISNVVTACVSNPDSHHLDQPVSFTFKHPQEMNESERLNYTCVFWERDVWSRRGCVASSNSTHTVCTCNHLSSFAVLMALYDIKHTFELQLLTWIGLAVSLACLFVCILTFGLCRSIKGTRTTIHLHLSLCLFLADLIFLCGISRAQKAGCGLVAGLLHYFFLAAFSWMLLEGVQLYRMVVLVFHTTLRPAHMMAVGYGAPLAIVIVSAIAYPQGYGTDQHCWLSLDHGFIWAFFGPVCIIIFLNALSFLITLWKLAEKLTSLNPDLSNLQMIKGFTVTAVAQLCVLGGMWVFGCFMFKSVAMAYLFTILNSLQGALIFIMHCLMSKPVRDEYAKFLRSICNPEKRKYTEYTSNPSSNSQQPLKTNPSTGQSQL
ncbi:adhesion G protein-coupled receptor E5 isoform X9 [Clupea harengus]|uniref:Adhesion G protein-coupled receptor E5 isoform X9 n=1 Tax=Clupea harengus TaxID=7950 RepID=A0A6P8F1B8_CLUHA|nr:adhesion G protein-coupled receptor E5 isoform X9 [Clupea harengus]